MAGNRRIQWLRLILFMSAMLLIFVSAPIINIFVFLFMYTLTWAFVKWEGGKSIVELGLEFDNQFFPHITIGAVAAAISTILVAAVAFFFGGQLRPFDEITGDLIFALITNAVLFSFFEELTQRGYILTRMEELGGRGAAIIFSSLFFSLLHFSWWEPAGFDMVLIGLFTINMFLGGVVLSLSYYWSGRRLWTPIAFHFMWNVLAYIMFPSFPQEVVIQPEIFQIEWGITTIIGFLVGLSILWSFLAIEKNKE